MPDPAPPDLSEEERAQLAKGVAEFNDGLFFECHDTLEDLWTGLRGPSRDFFQGLIQVAVAFHHFVHNNDAGALSMLGRALSRLAPYPDRYAGFDLGAHRAELVAWRERIRAGAPVPPSRGELPVWRFGEA